LQVEGETQTVVAAQITSRPRVQTSGIDLVNTSPQEGKNLSVRSRGHDKQCRMATYSYSGIQQLSPECETPSISNVRHVLHIRLRQRTVETIENTVEYKVGLNCRDIQCLSREGH
jgi:hypothetical protein